MKKFAILLALCCCPCLADVTMRVFGDVNLFTPTDDLIVEISTTASVNIIMPDATQTRRQIKFILVSPSSGGITLTAIPGQLVNFASSVSLGTSRFSQAIFYSDGVAWFGFSNISGGIAGTGSAGTGSCTNQAVTAVNAGLPTCSTITSLFVDTSIAKTGADINTSNQVTVTHLSSALPVNQGGTGTTSTLAGIIRGGSPVTGSELSGDVTTSGSNAATVVKVNGGSVPTSSTVLGSNGSSQLVNSTVQGNGSKVQLSTGSTTTNDCVKYDSSGNAVDAGVGCAGGICPFGVACIVPVIGNFTAVNLNGATATTKSNRVAIALPKAAGTNFRGWFATPPSTPYTIDICFDGTGIVSSGGAGTFDLAWGIAVRNSGTQVWRTLFSDRDESTLTTDTSLTMQNVTGDGSASTTVIQSYGLDSGNFQCFSITNDGATMQFMYSVDGWNYLTERSEAPLAGIDGIGPIFFYSSDQTITAQVGWTNYKTTASVLGAQR